MNAWNAVLLGIIQGLTEFLPISSSGHLVLVQKLIGLNEGALTLDILMHAGTLLAVLWAFKDKVQEVIRNPLGELSRKIVVACLPTALIGFLFEDNFKQLFSSGQTLGIEFLLTGTVLWWAETVPAGRKGLRQMKWIDALWVGTLQGAAILPAISRSGLTLAGALWRGLNREFAAEFSFLVSVPVIMGALLLEMKDAFELGNWNSALSGMSLLAAGCAAVSGYFAIRFMLNLLTRSSMKGFAYYTWILGGLIVIDQLFFHFVFAWPF